MRKHLSLTMPLLLLIANYAYATSIWYWTSDENITNSSAYTDAGGQTSETLIALPQSSSYPMHVVWTKELIGSNSHTLYYKKKINATTWSQDVVLVSSPYLSKEHQFAIATDPTGEYVYVVYHDETYTPHCQVNLIRSTDGGDTWETPVRISPSTSSYYYQPAIAAASNGKVFIAWQQGWLYEDHKIGFAASSNYGVDWSITDQVDNTSAFAKILPSIAVDPGGNYVHLAWRNTFTTTRDISYRKYTVSTSSWGNITTLSTHQLYDYVVSPPHIACSKVGTNKVYVVWSDNSYDMSTSTNDVYYRRSTDNGSSWSTETILSGNVNNYYDSDNPTISASFGSDNYVDLAYSEYNTQTGNRNTYWRRSTNGGSSWGTITQFSSTGPNNGCWVATDYNNWSHIFFGSSRDNNYEMYYKSYMSSQIEDSPQKDICDDTDKFELKNKIVVSPNPVKNQATIYINNPINNNKVKLNIYDIQGKLIRTLNITKLSQNASIKWDCKDNNGSAINSGVYLIKYNDGISVKTCRFTLIK